MAQRAASTVSAEQAEEPTIESIWKRRISDARTRRERFENDWQTYARLHTNAYRAVRDKNDDENVVLPNGDQIKLGLVHRNLEQTFALLDIPSISVKATLKDVNRPTGAQDTHTEALVEQALQDSLQSGGGLMAFRNVADKVKRDGVMIGHGVCYSWWRFEQEEREGEAHMVMAATEDGGFAPATDEAGQPVYQRAKAMETVYEGVQDEYVSPLEFLFDASALEIMDAGWHGMEKVTTLDALRARGFEIPEGLKASAYRRRTLYGDDPQTDEELEENCVKLLTIWDKRTRKLLHFLETCSVGQGKPSRRRSRGVSTNLDMYLLGDQPWPVRFDHPDKSPFEIFVPIPANDLPYGISQVEHIRNPALEADKLRTRAANLTREQKMLLLYRSGYLQKDELERALQSPDSAAVGVNLPEDVKWGEFMNVIRGEGARPELLQQIATAVDDVRDTSGVSEVPLGGAETATESERLYAIGSARVGRKRTFYVQFLTRVAETHRCLLRAFSPSGQAVVIQDVDGSPILLSYGREAFQGKYSITVFAGESGMSPVRQKFLSDMFGQLSNRFGPQFDLALLRQTLTLFDVKEVESLMRAARSGLQLQAPQAFMPQGGPQGLPPPGVPAPAPNLQNLSNGGAVRSATNALTEQPAAGARR